MDHVMGAMSMLPSKLLELLNEEYKLQSGVRAKIESLSRELESTYVAISMVAQVPPEHLNPQVAVWAREVREASYDMEDILDTFLVRVDGGGPPQPAADPDWVRRLMKKMGKLFDLSKVKARHDIARGIEGIEKKVKEIAERRARYRVDDLVGKRPAAITSDDDPRLPFLYKTRLSQLVGINETRGAVMEMLSKNEDNMEMKIISIVGFGGLGKTTLAKAVYDKESPEFDCRAFVQVGRHPNKSKVLKDILIDLISNEAPEKSIDPDNKRHNNSDFDVADLDAKQLIDKLRRFLDKKRYFIVVDDIWDTSTWETVSSAFVDNNSLGSIIITTTRNSQVAAEIGGHVYRIKELSDSDSRKLFYTRIFGTEADKHPDNGELDEIASDIMRKCHGVPLAILAIASLLVTKPIKEWYNVYNTIGLDGDNRQVQNMMKILSFSYYDLPCHLRTCLLYLSVFPDGYLFERNELIWRWIAEGLVHEETGKVLFEVGVSYFHELINRNMILPEKEEQGLILCCRVHDMVLHLLRDLSDNKENFAAILDGEQLQVGQVQARRLAFHNLLSLGEQSHQQLKGIGVQKVRSLNAIICRGSMIPPVSSFQVLRALALIYCPGMDSHQFENIGKLHHLRYLRLSYTLIKAGELPAEVGRLKFLQTLILDNTGIKELPATMRCLSQLMCLRADEKTRAPDWIGELTSLVELEIYPGADDTCFVKELGKLINLMVLKTRIAARDEEQGRRLLKSLSELQKIQIMDIVGISNGFVEDVVMQPDFKLSDNLRVLMFRAIGFSRLPAWINISLLPNLCHIDLHMPEVGEKDLQILGRFPELRSLTIFSPQDREIRIPVIGGGGGFKKLRLLFVNFLMHFLQGALPGVEGIWLSLSVRQVKDNNLGTDMGLENLSSLEDVRVIINCLLAHPTEVDEVEAAVRHALDILPNRPTRKVVRGAEDGMVTGADEESRMLTRQHHRRQDVTTQYKFWTKHFQALCSAINEVLATIHEGHPSFIQRRAQELYQQLEETDERVHHELSQSTPSLGFDAELHQLIEDTAAIERALKIIRVKYPLLVAMLEELKAKLNRQDAEEGETAVKHAADIHPDTLLLRLRIQEKRAKLQFRFQTKLIHVYRGLVIDKTKMIHESDPIYAKVKKFRDHYNDTVQRANDELLQWDEDNDEEEHGLHQVIEDTAALERALKIYTDENPRLAAMEEELSAEIDQKEERDKKNPLYLFILLSRELNEVSASIPDGHPFVVPMNAFVDKFNNAILSVEEDIRLGEVPVDEQLEICTVVHRLLSAELEEVKAEVKLQLENDGVDNISEYIPEEEEELTLSNLSIN